MTTQLDYVSELHPWLTRYAAMDARHTERLAPYVDADGEPAEEHYDRYDEHRFDNHIEADEFLDRLMAHVLELVGPPLPGATHTLTFAGPKRHDGEKPYSWVVNGSDLSDAGRTLLTLPSFRAWFAEQGTYDDGSPPDVLYVAKESHPGLPAYGYFNDLRREQAAQQAAPEALPFRDVPAPLLALLG
ncbi:hypothetical protein [Streptomyces microflavus]|uniref:hypothetical protein n=1 Tax=Streptomyces microflavus TaxID=1919 RepID=UPI003667F0D1